MLALIMHVCFFHSCNQKAMHLKYSRYHLCWLYHTYYALWYIVIYCI